MPVPHGILIRVSRLLPPELHETDEVARAEIEKADRYGQKGEAANANVCDVISLNLGL
jgi:hypothetical protein